VYRAACRGLAVTVIDRELPGMGATQHSFGWIGRSTDSGPAAELRQLARADFLRLRRRGGGGLVHPGITLAATVGRLVAQELADGASEVPPLARCRMTRFG